MNEAIERIEKLLNFLEKERASKTGYGFLVFELTQILEILKPREETPEELGELLLRSNKLQHDDDDSFDDSF